MNLDLNNPALTVAIALATGIVATSLAHHLRLPSIVLLLAVGVLLGPDAAGVVRPDTLGDGLPALVGFAVAVILFEGGLSLDLGRLRREQKAIRRLVTVGAVVTTAGAALAARLLLGWDWRMSLLFGTLVIVTGPTVVNPLLRRLHAKRTVGTVLEAEGILIDAIGAIIAAVALEVALTASETLVDGALSIGLRLGFGVLAGIAGGAVLAFLLRFRDVVPEGLGNVLTLGLAFLIFEVASSLVPESGIAAVVVAGMVVGHYTTHVKRALAEFEEQLTTLLIGMLFVLLAADVRLSDVTALGWPAVAVTGALIVLVRPVNVLASTFGTNLTWRERTFVACIAPRGIVAAAVASLFAIELDSRGVPGGDALRALVFLTISVTVLWAGLTGPITGALLGTRRKADAGWVVLGGNDLARLAARVLKEGSEVALVIDSDPKNVEAAEKEGLRAILGNGLEDNALRKAELESRTGAIGLTTSEEVNLLFVQKAKELARYQRYYVTLDRWDTGVTREMVEGLGAAITFGSAVAVDKWASRIRHGTTVLQRWKLRERRAAATPCTADEASPPYVALAHGRRHLVQPLGERSRFRRGDVVSVLVDAERHAEASQRFEERGWELVEEQDPGVVQDAHGPRAGSTPRRARRT